MAHKYFNEVKSHAIDSIKESGEMEETLTGAGNGDWYIIPENISSVMVWLEPTAGSGKVQYTVDSLEKVKAGTAVAKDWDAGVVTALTDDVLFPVTAIRQENISGTTRLAAKAQ